MPAGERQPGRPVHRRRSPVNDPRSAVPRSAAPRSTAPRATEEVSAGGLVVSWSDGSASVALIARRNRSGRLEWCLPKGHLEGTETAEEAAVREVAEETGIQGKIVRALGSIDYWFSVEGRRIHKTVHHYLLDAVGGALSIEGDPDAEAVDAAWVPLTELAERLAFANERRIARAASEILERPA